MRRNLGGRNVKVTVAAYRPEPGYITFVVCNVIGSVREVLMSMIEKADFLKDFNLNSSGQIVLDYEGPDCVEYVFQKVKLAIRNQHVMPLADVRMILKEGHYRRYEGGGVEPQEASDSESLHEDRLRTDHSADEEELAASP